MQVASYTNVIANGGVLYRPYIVNEIKNCQSATKFEKFIINQDFIKKNNINLIQKGLRMVVTDNKGTATSLALFVDIAGKTGTSPNMIIMKKNMLGLRLMLLITIQRLQ